jgi:hypothetical protein
MYVFSGVLDMLTEGQTDRQTDRQTDIAKLIFTSFSFLTLNAPKNLTEVSKSEGRPICKKTDQNSHYGWKHFFLFLIYIHRKRKKQKQN